MTDLGIVIVNYNTRDDLGNCLASLRASTQRYTRRVLVIDNASNDGSAELVRTSFVDVAEIIETGVNGGYAYANNIGMRALGLAQGQPPAELPRYVLLLNPDTVLPPDALDAVVAFMDAHGDIGVLGPKLVRQDGSLDLACRRSFPTPTVSFYRLSGLSRLFPRSRVFGRYNLTFLDPDEQADVDSVVGAFMLMRTVALQAAGLLDEAFFMYGEDLDLCYRIKELDWRVVYYPQVTVLHLKGASSRKNAVRATRAFYEAMKIFHDKHYRAQSPAWVNLAVDAGVVLMRWAAELRNRLRPKGIRRVASA
ncbi:MAG: glycosyltransferase family 2 protein [Chloroflexi bacterium]|jgi:N-acetylglucosaminyl-diphospho-decaprenol L-rhamnosyltransferase|nr:glycosyltransferase family 2 protein [Chloroflexota bacterium]